MFRDEPSHREHTRDVSRTIRTTGGTDGDVHHVGLTLAPSDTVELGALFFQFDNAGDGFLDGNEFDLYAQWVVNEHLVISPLVGFYSPDNSAAEGGTQLGDDDTNIYSQVIAIVSF